jgi:hypothetical protein
LSEVGVNEIEHNTLLERRSSMEPTKGDGKTVGVVLTVIGAAIAMWVLARFGSVTGQLHTWGPPFTAYERMTLIGAGLAGCFLFEGINRLMKK